MMDGDLTAALGDGSGGTAPQSPGGGNGSMPISAPEWTQGYEPDVAEWVARKNYKSPAELAKGFLNLEKSWGSEKSRSIAVPTDDNDAAWSEVFKRLGRPDAPEGYGIKAPEGDDGAMAKALGEVFHRAGLNPRQAGLLHDWLHSTASDQEREEREERERTFRSEQERLRSEWGKDYDARIDLGNRAARAMGMSMEDMVRIKETLGPRFLLEKLANAGQWLREDAGVGMAARSGGFGTPEAARARISSLGQDKEFMTKLYDGDGRAKEEWDLLFKTAYPG
jgi:hypothetical protein